MNRRATLFRKSDNGKKAIYIDDENTPEIFAWLKEDPKNNKKFLFIVEQLLNGKITRDLYNKENIEKGCEHVTAIKPFRGTKNPRLYCQQFTKDDTKVFIMVVSELLPKKKSQKLTKKEKAIIRRVAAYKYEI